MKHHTKDQLSFELRTELHTHTTCSDGALSPEQLIARIREFNIGILAITDHDSTDAFHRAKSPAMESGIELLSGAELTCSEGGREIHLLAYCFDPLNEALQELLCATRSQRVRRCEKMLAKLDALGLSLSLEEVKEQVKGQSIVRPHIAAAMVKKGIVASNEEAFDKYLSNDGPVYVAIDDLPVHEVIPVIHQAGGVAIIAHPSKSVTINRIVELLDCGLDGIEVYHPSHTRSATSYYRNFAKSYNLIATGGSDFHGGRTYDEANFGRYSIDVSMIDRMKSLAASRAKQAVVV